MNTLMTADYQKLLGDVFVCSFLLYFLRFTHRDSSQLRKPIKIDNSNEELQYFFLKKDSNKVLFRNSKYIYKFLA